MSINLTSLDLTRPTRDVDIVDKHGESIGLTFTVVPQESDQYQRAFRIAQDKFASGKKLSAKARREINDNLLMARVSGWKWSGKALENNGGEQPEFNKPQLKSVLFEQGESSAAIRLQLSEAIGQEEESFTDE